MVGLLACLPGAFLTITMSAANHLYPLREAIHNQVNPFQDFTVDPTYGDKSFIEPERICLRLVHLRPSRFHTVRLPVPSGGKAQDKDIAVSLHLMNVEADPNQQDPLVMSDPCKVRDSSVFMLRNVERIPYDDLCAMCTWTATGRTLALHGFPVGTRQQALHELLSHLMNSMATCELEDGNDLLQLALLLQEVHLSNGSVIVMFQSLSCKCVRLGLNLWT